MVSDISHKRCVPCEGDVARMSKDEATEYLETYTPTWKLEWGDFLPAMTCISKRFEFENFRESLELTNRIGEIAEREWHHPDLKIGWGYVEVSLTTHAIKGLSENDFIIASQIDKIT